ncbi:MAG: hypothetical protein ABI818_10650 [Acidobacteriota bacterium]
MEKVIPVLAMVGVLAAWQFFFYKQSDGRIFSPLWMAFGTTTASLVFIVGGMIGYNLDRHDRFVAGTAWAGKPIAWEIWSGVAFAIVATYLWRRGLRSLRTV